MPEDQALRLVVEGTSSETGAEFFRALVKNLAAVMGTAGAWIAEYVPETNTLRSRAAWLNGGFIEDYEQAVANTPCEAVLTERKLVHYPDRIVELFPGEVDLIEIGAVSYMGVPLFDLSGEIMGHLAVVDTKPMPAEPRMISMFEIFAARAAAECRRLKSEQKVRDHEEELTALLDSAMDAVVVLDAACVMQRVNPAAEKLFRCTDEDLLGERLCDFLPPESAARFESFLKELERQSEGDRHLWIPESFVIMRWDKTHVPVEATLSRFESRGRTFNTLILRNVDERLAAEQKIRSLTVRTEYLQAELRALQNFGSIIGNSAALRQVLREVEQVAATDATVLIQGETGTGKELFAHAIHAASKRSRNPLVTVNCAAIPAALIESEFFGHEKGAFTGATSRREGRFTLADGGTIFLDEVGELPLDLQGKLLRVLQEGTFEPVGSSATRKVDVRVVAATNRDLPREVGERRFREDLFYRLNVFPLSLPPLRERPEDIPALATAFARRFAEQMGKTATLTTEDMRRLQSYAWPGNVRELRNVIERAVITATGSRPNLDRALPDVAPTGGSATATAAEGAAIRTLKELEDLERENLRRALEASAGRVSGPGGAAELVGMNPSTLRSRMKTLGVTTSSSTSGR